MKATWLRRTWVIALAIVLVLSSVGLVGASPLGARWSVFKFLRVQNELDVAGATTLGDTLDVTSDATVGGDLVVTGAVSASGSITDNGHLTMDDIRATDAITSAGTLASVGAASFASLTVTGTTGLTGATTVAGLANLNGGIAVDTSNFTVSGSTGAVATVSTLVQTLVNVAGASANPYDYTGTLGAMNGSDDFTLFDVDITNADHTSTGNTVQALDIAAITGDADATETAIKVGAGWDTGITSASAVAFNGGITADSTAFTVADTSGDVGTAGTLTAAGVAALNGGITVDSTNFTVHGTTGAVHTAGAFDTSTTATVGTFLVLTKATPVAVTAALAIVPTASYQPLTSATAITDATLSTSGAVAGELVRFVNANASDGIGIVEGSTGKMASTDITLGPFDAVLFMYDGTYWVQTAPVEDN